ncbi:MAG TPA: universal stress protein [Nocardioidaceae bacterium]|nr:universal stress protein [Nocardioidaceae bacterium]
MKRPALIVVGLDGSPAARAALDVALEEGLLRGATVEVVTAWVWASPYEGMAHADTFEEAKAAAWAMQDELIGAAVAKLPEPPVISQSVVHDYAGKVLVERAGRAALLVVGHGRRGLISRALLGSVSEYCVKHSSAPVLVVPDVDQGDALESRPLAHSARFSG